MFLWESGCSFSFLDATLVPHWFYSLILFISNPLLLFFFFLLPCSPLSCVVFIHPKRRERKRGGRKSWRKCLCSSGGGHILLSIQRKALFALLLFLQGRSSIEVGLALAESWEGLGERLSEKKLVGSSSFCKKQVSGAVGSTFLLRTPTVDIMERVFFFSFDILELLWIYILIFFLISKNIFKYQIISCQVAS